MLLSLFASRQSSLWVAGMHNLHMTVQNDAEEQPGVFKLAGYSRDWGTEWVFEKKERTLGSVRMVPLGCGMLLLSNHRLY